jgi:N-acetyl-anhydromuramyl-L-alanine amidase AmpD
MRYPNARWVPWQYLSPQGQATYYKGQNRPNAVVLHVMQGYATTAARWAATGYFGASWHFTVDRDGGVMQHLELNDGGYHAGIPSTAPTPTWELWRGHGQNVNTYTVGIEMEGFSGTPFSEAQSAAVRTLCRWLSEVLGFPYERKHFPAHAEIDLVNRPSDFAPPAMRAQFYQYLFEEDDMTPQEREDLKNLVAIFGGSQKIAEAARGGMDYMLGYSIEQQKLSHHIAQHPGPASIPDHIHTPGKVVQQ